MVWEKLVLKYRCEVYKNLANTKAPVNIRKALENRDIDKLITAIKAEDHAPCPFSCPWRMWTYIEGLEDPSFLLQDLVKTGEENLKKKRKEKAEKTLKNSMDPDTVPTEAENKRKPTRDDPSDIRELMKEDEGRWEKDVLAPIKGKGQVVTQ